MKRLLILASLFALLALNVFARPWKVNGKTIQAELVGYDQAKKIVWLQEKWKNPLKVNLYTLDEPSIDYIINNEAGLVKYKDVMITKTEKEKREKRDYEIENAPYVFDSKRIHSSHDDFNNNTIYKTELAPSVETPYGECCISMIASRRIEGGTNAVNIIITADYSGDDWIFARDVTMLGANGLKYTFCDDNPRHDVKGGLVFEFVSAIVAADDIFIIERIIQSGRVRVRFAHTGSSGYTVDWEMRGYQKRSCLDIINAYKKLRAASNKTKVDAPPNAAQGKE
ncbi:MAG: hypothetical protein IKJ45_10960 [Kiritimatiellae bacterium]|nr:hypothetical protein [Kiritimatiellia bacterium]